MKGKEKCKALKELRQKIAEENDIEFAVSECTHQGDCLSLDIWRGSLREEPDLAKQLS